MARVDVVEGLALRFEGERGHLRAVAYRMLGSVAEAEDAVQEAWLRLDRSDVGGVANLGGWLTTVVGRICLDMLRSRTSRREDSLEVYVPDPIVDRADRADGVDPEHEALLADSVGLALLVVLDALPPAERVAFVLHDMFAVPFDDLAPILDRSPAAARQLASRARRRVRAERPETAVDAGRQREVVEAFLAASRGGDFEALLALLDPDVVLRADAGAGGMSKLLRGARTVVEQALLYARLGSTARVALVNGVAGLVNVPNGQAQGVMAFTVVDGRIVEVNLLVDRARLTHLDGVFADS